MTKDKTIAIQQKIIEQQTKEIEELKLKISSLQEELEVEQLKPKEGYEKAKQLIISLENKRETYSRLIKELNEIKSEYKNKIKEIDLLKIQYSKVMDDVLKKIKKGIKKIT